MAICKYCKKEKPDDGRKMCQSCRDKSHASKLKCRSRAESGEEPIRGSSKFIVKPKYKTKKKANARLDEKIKTVDEYNEKYGTRLTYGKYMGLVYMGKV